MLRLVLVAKRLRWEKPADRLSCIVVGCIKRNVVSVSLSSVLTRIHDSLFLFLYPGLGLVYTSFGPSHGLPLVWADPPRSQGESPPCKAT